jgi:hypothetical protein
MNNLEPINLIQRYIILTGEIKMAGITNVAICKKAGVFINCLSPSIYKNCSCANRFDLLLKAFYSLKKEKDNQK